MFNAKWPAQKPCNVTALEEACDATGGCGGLLAAMAHS